LFYSHPTYWAIASVVLILAVYKIEGKLPRINRYQVLQIIFLGMTGVFAYNVFFFNGLKAGQ